MREDFLRVLWGPLRGTFGEVRCIGGGARNPGYYGVITQRFFQNPDEAFEWADIKNLEGADAYFGVLPRVRKSGTAADIVDMTSVLWADVDAKKVSDIVEVGKFQALTTINAFPVPPQLLVDSGGGWHCYWLLNKPVPYVIARPVMSWIAARLKGDHVQDSPRVLRVPGTTNWKREPYVEARIVRFDESHRYRLTDFESLMPIERPAFRPNVERVRIADLPDWLNTLITEGAPRGARSETCFRTMLWLLRYGRTTDEIRAIFIANPEGIGAKYDEKPIWDADRWLSYTLKAAEAEA